MTNYYILNDKRTNPNFDAHVQGLLLNDKKEMIRNPFNKGESIDYEGKYFVKVIDNQSESGINRDKLSLSIQNNEALFVVNDKLQKLLREFCEALEFYDLTIKKGSEINEEYKIVNITKYIDCIDREESNLIYWEMTHDTVYNIDELVLEEELIPAGLNMFLLGGVRGTVVVIHKRLKDAIQEQKISGFNFCEIKDFIL